MKKTNKNSLLATTQRQGIKNKTILKILAFLIENVKYIVLGILIAIFSIWIGEVLGRWLAYGL